MLTPDGHKVLLSVDILVNKYAHIISHKCHALHIFHEDYVHIHTKYEVTSINYVTQSTVHIPHKLHFMLLAYVTEQIWLSHCKYMSH